MTFDDLRIYAPYIGAAATLATVGYAFMKNKAKQSAGYDDDELEPIFERMDDPAGEVYSPRRSVDAFEALHEVRKALVEDCGVTPEEASKLLEPIAPLLLRKKG
jgi:hypothetical protein